MLTALAIISLSLSAGKTTKLFVADHKDYCNATNEDKCLLTKTSKGDNWKISNTIIDGFTYQEGYEYLLKVKEVNTANGELHYKLSKVLTKTKTNYNPANELYNKQWFLYTMYEDTTFINLVDTTVVFMKLDSAANKINVRGVCNNLSGAISVEGNKISIANLVSTKMACKGVMLEEIVSSMLQYMTNYKLRGNTLTLYSDIRSMVFKYRPEKKK